MVVMTTTPPPSDHVQRPDYYGESGIEAPGLFAQRIQHWYALRACHLVWSGELLAWRLWFVIPALKLSRLLPLSPQHNSAPNMALWQYVTQSFANYWHRLTVL